ncbi:unnamed protein product [Linum tenue]|uniref:C3H1-type domain-containing protein n=1 Tax=Linum tenue TaxID=586396 RepID=A0AAV0QTC0_9ROSI|nr:unnamed protein product [Linum tenue]
MEEPESANSIADPSGASLLEIQSPSPLAPVQDPDPQPSSCEHALLDHAADKDEEQLEQLHQLVEKQLQLKQPLGEEEGLVVLETERDSSQLNGQREVEEQSVEQHTNGESDVLEEPNVRNMNEGAETVEENEGDEEWKQTKSNGGGMIRQHQFPVRPEAEDCSYYMKTGNCRFASNCKFNHPAKQKTQVTRERMGEKEESAERPEQIECKYYLRTGGCKYGKACRFNHSKVRTPAVFAKSPVVQILEFNFLGLPIRPGEKECPYYMRNGSCKYGSNCRFNHPDPTVVGANEHSSPIANGGSSSINASSHSNIPPWSPPPPRPALNDTPPNVPILFPSNQSTSSQNLEWNGHQAPVYPPPEQGMAPSHMPYFMINPAIGTNIYSRQQQPMVVDEYPERPGQPDCSYFLKTGGCKFKGNCKFNHPKTRITKSPSCILSDKGLPLRPDQNVCAYYSRYGICKFGPACKFDHPIQVDSSTGSLDRLQFRAFGNSGTHEEDDRLAENVRSNI